jgi:hypothetical protein
LPFKVSLAQF